MQYYVIGPDGSKYGPADVPTLKQWAAENRLNPDAMLEDFNTGQRVAASQVPGIFEAGAPGAPVPSAPTTTTAQREQMSQQLPSGSSGPSLYDSPVGNMPPGYYQRQGLDGGSKELTLSYVFSAIGFICCPIIFSVLGIVYAGKAGEKGNPSAGGARTLGIISLVVGIIIGVVSTMMRLGTLGR
jgi:hypothetical protein